MLRKKKVVGPHGGDDKTGSSKEDMEESWEMVAMEKDELELLTRKPTQEDIEASMAAGQESCMGGGKGGPWDSSVCPAHTGLNPCCAWVLACLLP